MADPKPHPQQSQAPAASPPASSSASPNAAEAMAEKAMADASRAVNTIAGETGSTDLHPLDLQSFSAQGANSAASGNALSMLDDVQLHVKVELGRTRMYVEDVLRLGSDSVIELDKAAGDPVDIYVNDRHVARGEVLVVNENFCVRVSEILIPIAPD